MRLQAFWGQPLVTIIILLVTSIQAKKDLDKPSLFKNGLNDLKAGLTKHLPVPKYRVTKWKPGWTMDDCKKETIKANVTSLEKLETFTVYYDDCDHPWTICRHTDSSDLLTNIVENFGRVPVRARSYVNGVLSLKAKPDQNHAKMADAIIVMFYRLDPKEKHKTGNGQSNPAIFIHETGHALDRLAYGNISYLSTKPEYRKEYAKDSKVVDDYAASTFLENVAQNTVIATYDLAVPGGFRSITKDWRSVQHQLNIMKRKQKEAGDILVAYGKCGHRVKERKPVSIPLPKGRNLTRREMFVPSTVQLDGELEPGFFPSGPSGRAHVAETIPNVDLQEGLEVITPRSEVDNEHICEPRDL